MSGRPFRHSDRRSLDGCPLFCQQPDSRPRCGMVWLYDCGDHLMRTHRQLVVYESILQMLQEPGCPFCRFLKFQTATLHSHPEENVHRLCNSYTWGLAAVQNALAAPQVFIKLVDKRGESSKSESGCDICGEVLAEEEPRLREFASCLRRNDVTQWLRVCGFVYPPRAEVAQPSLACAQRPSRRYHRKLSPATGARTAASECRTTFRQSRMERTGSRGGVSCLAKRATFLREDVC
jgi:hypothetical protein